MKISQVKSTTNRRGPRQPMFSAAFDARDFPKRELIEPKLVKMKLELTDEYRGTSSDIFLAEALTVSPQVVLRSLTLANFEFERPVSLASSLDVAAWGARFGFSNLNDWNTFHRIATMALTKTKLPELSQLAYAAYLFSLIHQDRAASYQISGVIMSLSTTNRSPLISRSQIESFLRIRGEFGPQINVDLVANLLSGFTLVEALELIGAKLNEQQLLDATQIRCDFKYDASVSELISMLGTSHHRWLQKLMA